MVDAELPREDMASLLRWYVDHGLDETIGEEAIDRFGVAPASLPLGNGLAVPIELEPAKRVNDLIDVLRRGALPVRVLDA